MFVSKRRARGALAGSAVTYDIEIVLVGLIADTHGLIRAEALRALVGVDLILHAGDVGKPQVLHALEMIAPVRAVRGNTDPIALHLPDSVDVELEGVRIHVSHGHEVGSPTPERLAARYRADVIVYGHTHRPLTKQVGDVLVVNPGAAGPRRFDIKPSVALLSLPDRRVRMIELEPWDNHSA
jgi:putative phosphoesterase